MTRHISARAAELLQQITTAHEARKEFPAYYDEYQSYSDEIVDAAMALLDLQEGSQEWRIECRYCDYVTMPRETVGQAVAEVAGHERSAHPSAPLVPAPVVMVHAVQHPSPVEVAVQMDAMGRSLAHVARRQLWAR